MMSETINNFVFSAVFFTIFWGAAMWFTRWKKKGTNRQKAVCLSVVTGLLYASLQLLFKRLL
ncbi:DUF6404 family protein [Pseudomonas graminis]